MPCGMPCSLTIHIKLHKHSYRLLKLKWLQEKPRETVFIFHTQLQYDGYTDSHSFKFFACNSIGKISNTGISVFRGIFAVHLLSKVRWNGWVNSSQGFYWTTVVYSANDIPLDWTAWVSDPFPQQRFWVEAKLNFEVSQTPSSNNILEE